MQTHWINNQPVVSAGQGSLPVLNPATEEVLDVIPEGDPRDVDHAVAAARKAFRSWAHLAPIERRQYLRRVAQAIEEHGEAIARLLTLEQGKPLGESRAEVAGVVKMVEEYAELVVAFRAGSQGSAVNQLVFQQWEPRGVAACIVPWNYPLQVAFETIAPNLAVGNTVVAKPSERTPLTLRFIAEHAFRFLPEGVCNVLLGDGPHCGEPLVTHQGTDVVMFIGSVATGRRIGMLAGGSLKKVILELGGKDPFIVDDTVDVWEAAKLAADACFANAGQICTSSERVYVQDTIFDEFAEALVTLAQSLRLGSGLDPEVDMGPIIDERQRQVIDDHVREAEARGAKILVGGRRTAVQGRGFFYLPTVMTGVEPSMLIMQKETFGPVAPLVPFHDFDEAIAMANDTEYGLAAIVCTTNAKHAIKAIRELQAGMIKINTRRGKSPGATSEPFKNSGVGKGYGMEVLQELTRQKSIHWKADL